MKNKKIILPIIVLVSICVAVAAILGAVNMITSPVIKDREEAKANAALLEVLPGAKNFEEIVLNENYPGEIKKAYKASTGFVFEVEVKGKDTMTVMCGVDLNGSFVKLNILSENETPGFKENVFPLVTGDAGVYNGKNSETLAPEMVSGATLTSTGVYNAVKAALDGYTVAMGGKIEPPAPKPSHYKTESELLPLMAELTGTDKGFAKLELSGEYQTLGAVYKENGGSGYVAYVAVLSENYEGVVESEALIYVANNLKISAIKKLAFKTSDAIYGYVPPTLEQIDAFYGRLPSNTLSTIDGVELVTNATNTSTNAVNSIKEALGAVAILVKQDMPTPEAEVLSLAAELIPGADFENVTPEGSEYVKRIYKDKNGKGYVAYVVVISANYGTVESESLIYVGNDGKIKDIKKMTFKTSDAIYGYVPPTLEQIDAFYARIPGSALSTIEGVEVVSNATNTSNNLIKSVKEALSAVAVLIEQDMPTAEADLFAIAEALVGEKLDLEKVAISDTTYVRRVFRDKNGNGFIAYVVVISANYGTVESESLIYIGNDGNIEGIKKINFKTSDAIYGYVPPTLEQIDAFYERLNGKNSVTIDGVELVSNATNTSTNAVNAIKEALVIVDGILPTNNAPRIIGIAVLAAAIISFVTVFVIKRKKRGGKCDE